MSLRHLALRDFVIVDALELDLDTGFTVLTGETGAGKSILLDAIQFVLGARADGTLIREGAVRLEVSAEFDTVPTAAQPILDEQGIDCTNNTLLLRRTLDGTGKTRAWINGTPCTATQLRQLGDHLIDIHGQHAWQQLTRPGSVQALLDNYAAIDTQPLTHAWQRWRAAQQAVEAARDLAQTHAAERDRVAWQLAEIDKLGPSTDEWPELNTRHARLANAQALLESATQALHLLDGDDGSALSQLNTVQHHLATWTRIEPDFAAALDLLDTAQTQLSEMVHSLNAVVRRTELDPQGLAEIDQRMGLWLSLARRFRQPPEHLAAWAVQLKIQLTELETAGDLEALTAQAAHAHAHWLKTAQAVSLARKAAAPKLSRAVTQAIQALGMEGGQFDVVLTPLEPPTTGGLEQTELWIAGHPGAALRPINKVASGGELSRIALAIAVTTSAVGSAPTLLFDEVDAGIGGAVAHTVGRLMQNIGTTRQVLAVTHLAQVAASAHHHWQVSKQLLEGRTVSRLLSLQGEPRVREIGRMLGGSDTSMSTQAHAGEMLFNAGNPSS
jgi:DNA repair protein RecN (Recombination protein N)